MKTALKSWAEIVIESVNYIIISYALSCMTFLFRTDWLFVLFFASEIWLLSKYFAALNKLTKEQNRIRRGMGLQPDYCRLSYVFCRIC